MHCPEAQSPAHRALEERIHWSPSSSHLLSGTRFSYLPIAAALLKYAMGVNKQKEEGGWQSRKEERKEEKKGKFGEQKRVLGLEEAPRARDRARVEIIGVGPKTINPSVPKASTPVWIRNNAQMQSIRRNSYVDMLAEEFMLNLA